MAALRPDTPKWAEDASVSLLRALHRQVCALLQPLALGTGRCERRQQLAAVKDSLHLLFRIEQELLYPQLAAVLDPATLNAARYSQQRIEQHLRAVIVQGDGGPDSGHPIRNLHQLVLAHQNFQEKRLFGAVAKIDSAALCARIDALCNEDSPLAAG